MFEVIPAIDVQGGALVGWSSSGPRRIAAFGGDPVAAAAASVAAGARWVHVVDVDLAVEGEPRNLEVLTAIAALPVAVQAAGGVRSADEVRTLLAAGASRVVLGSAALRDAPLVTGVDRCRRRTPRGRDRGSAREGSARAAAIRWICP